MKCINTGCTIYHVCKIKEVAHHCVVHQKLILTNNKDSFGRQVQVNPYPVFENPDEKVDSYDDNQKK